MNRKLQKFQAYPRTAIGFLPEYLDFQRGLRVGNLADHERITRILKLALEARYQQPFVTERYGRGVFWRWIGFLPRANRDAKPLSSRVSFGCSKFFLTMDVEAQLFKCGFSVERGMIRAPRDFLKARLQADWDWHRLLAALKPAGPMDRELRRLVFKEGFWIEAGGFDARDALTRKTFPGAAALRKMLEKAPAGSWAGFQVFYPMSQEEVRRSTGVDLIESMLAIFEEVTPAMNLCMQIQLEI